MSDVTPFAIGAEVYCRDGADSWGRLDRMVVEPLGRTVTHLVVEPHHRRGLGRLVPARLVAPGAVGDDGRITLSCTTDELEAMDNAEETRFLPGTGLEGYDPSATLAWPFFGLAAGGMGTTMGSLGLAGLDNAPQPLVVDRIPSGEVELHRGDPVHAVDGHIGKVRGLAVDPATRQVTHVLLDEGHLWGKKQVAIPVSELQAIGEGRVEVRLTKAEIKDLPAIELATMSPPEV